MPQVKKGILYSNASLVTLTQRISDILIVSSTFGLISIFKDEALTISLWVILLGVLSTYLFIAELFHLYRSWRGENVLHEIYHVSGVLLCSMIVFYFFNQKIINIPSLVIQYHTLWFVSALSGLLIFRITLRQLLKEIRKRGYNSRAAVIVGASSLGTHLANQLNKHPSIGIKLLGFYDDNETNDINVDGSSFPIFGEIEQLIADAKGGAIDRVYITLPMRYEKRIHYIVNELSDSTCSVLLVPDIFTFNLLHSRTTELNGIPLISIFDTPIFGSSAVVKRLEDIILSSVILIMISPILCLIACAVKMTSQGPVIFKQLRYGIDGKSIEIWKFRSMSVMENGNDIKQAKKNDSRLTPIGGFLRRTSLDELPQFINVLKGDMSIVGPRPHAIKHNEYYRQIIQGYMLRHKVKPGITGLAQVNGWRGETDTIEKMKKRIEFDLQYIQSWSMWLDLKIIILTLKKGFINNNAY